MYVGHRKEYVKKLICHEILQIHAGHRKNRHAKYMLDVTKMCKRQICHEILQILVGYKKICQQTCYEILKIHVGHKKYAIIDMLLCRYMLDITKMCEKQAGAELGQAQAQFELLMKFKLTLQLEFATGPGGWWVVGAGFYEINAKPSSN